MWYLIVNHDTGDSRKVEAANAETALAEVRRDKDFITENPVRNDVGVYQLAEDASGDPRTWHKDELI